jgi:type III secretion protein L
MSWLLVEQGDHLLATDRPIVKAPERAALTDTNALLREVRGQRAAEAAAVAEAREQARFEGHAEGVESGRRAFAEAVARLSAQTVAHHRREEADIAQLALAALRHMVAGLGDEAMMAGIARRAVAAVMPAEQVLVETSEAMLGPVTAALGDHEGAEGVTVRADLALGDRQCRITAADGRVIADLDVQLAALEERWGAATHVD